MPALQTDTQRAPARPSPSNRSRVRRAATEWITAATIYGAAALTTIGFVVASVIDAVLDPGRGRRSILPQSRSVAPECAERQSREVRLPRLQRRHT